MDSRSTKRKGPFSRFTSSPPPHPARARRMMGNHRLRRRIVVDSQGEVLKMVGFVTVFRRSAQVLRVALALGLMAGCGEGRSGFIGSRAKDTCDAQWPVCSDVAGCILGQES